MEKATSYLGAAGGEINKILEEMSLLPPMTELKLSKELEHGYEGFRSRLDSLKELNVDLEERSECHFSTEEYDYPKQEEEKEEKEL